MSETAKSDHLSQRSFQKVARFMMENTGIFFPESKRYLIEGRLRKRQRAHSIKKLDDYIEFALKSPANNSEQSKFIDALTTNKTDFFRENLHFEWLKNEYLPKKFSMKTPHNSDFLNVWSAGCSSGEEPYSLSIVLEEARNAFTGLDYRIQATDISDSMLEVAQRAVYPHERIEPMPRFLREKYLLRSKDKKKNLVKMTASIRQKVSFSKFNLITDSFDFGHQFDIIFCRNVMIYFNKVEREKLVKRFVGALKPGGIFFTGHSERLTEDLTSLQQLEPTIYRKVP